MRLHIGVLYLNIIRRALESLPDQSTSLTTMTDYKQLCAELVHIADAFDSGTELASNQGQAMDGYSALAAFRDVAYRARAALTKTEPEKQSVAATALRAAVDQVVPDQGDIWTRDLRGDAWIRWEERKLIRREILAIAAELKAQ